MTAQQHRVDERAVIGREGRFADRDAWSAEGWCTLERALDLIGTRSAMLILREAFYGTRRFDDFAQRTGFTDAVAAKRLKQLVDDGLLVRQPYREPGARRRYEYVLSDRGRELFPALVALINWGSGGRGVRRRIELAHASCGSPIEATVRCGEGHDVPLEQAAVRLTRGARRTS